jgi:hypothetical protein
MSRRLPVEGGLYEWARIAFNDQIGFLVAWNLWLYAILYVGLAGLVTITFASYTISGAAWMASSKWLIVGATFAVIAVTMLVARLGLGIGKWANNIGGVGILLAIAVLIVSPFLGLWRGTLANYHPLRLVMPPMTLFSLSVFSKMTFGALVRAALHPLHQFFPGLRSRVCGRRGRSRAAGLESGFARFKFCWDHFVRCGSASFIQLSCDLRHFFYRQHPVAHGCRMGPLIAGVVFPPPSQA